MSLPDHYAMESELTDGYNGTQEPVWFLKIFPCHSVMKKQTYESLLQHVRENSRALRDFAYLPHADTLQFLDIGDRPKNISNILCAKLFVGKHNSADLWAYIHQNHKEEPDHVKVSFADATRTKRAAKSLTEENTEFTIPFKYLWKPGKAFGHEVSFLILFYYCEKGLLDCFEDFGMGKNGEGVNHFLKACQDVAIVARRVGLGRARAKFLQFPRPRALQVDSQQADAGKPASKATVSTAAASKLVDISGRFIRAKGKREVLSFPRPKVLQAASRQGENRSPSPEAGEANATVPPTSTNEMPIVNLTALNLPTIKSASPDPDAEAPAHTAMLEPMAPTFELQPAECPNVEPTDYRSKPENSHHIRTVITVGDTVSESGNRTTVPAKPPTQKRKMEKDEDSEQALLPSKRPVLGDEYQLFQQLTRNIRTQECEKMTQEMSRLNGKIHELKNLESENAALGRQADELKIARAAAENETEKYKREFRLARTAMEGAECKLTEMEKQLEEHKQRLQIEADDKLKKIGELMNACREILELKDQNKRLEGIANERAKQEDEVKTLNEEIEELRSFKNAILGTTSKF